MVLVVGFFFFYNVRITDILVSTWLLNLSDITMVISDFGGARMSLFITGFLILSSQNLFFFYIPYKQCSFLKQLNLPKGFRIPWSSYPSIGISEPFQYMNFPYFQSWIVLLLFLIFFDLDSFEDYRLVIWQNFLQFVFMCYFLIINTFWARISRYAPFGTWHQETIVVSLSPSWLFTWLRWSLSGFSNVVI